jgi:DNA-binding transcriptional ArsR family regulator
MPSPDLAPLLPEEPVRLALEPAHNALYSMLMLSRAADYSGLSEWVMATAERLGPEALHRNRVVLEGLHYAAMPEASYPSFWAYLDALSAANPVTLRDRLLRVLWAHSRKEPAADAPPPPANPADLMASAEAYLSFCTHYFSGSYDLEIEAEAYEYLADPPRMHALILGHLRSIWTEHLAPEWERRRGQLLETIEAVRKLDLAGRPPREAVELVIGQELPSKKWEEAFTSSRQIILAPSPHLGPYVMKFWDAGVLRIFFGARLPAGAERGASELSRADLLVRLGALNDDVRLRVLAMLAREEELCAPELMVRLDLHQSAVSRHLRQLVAAGYVSERWREGSKCYRLNRERIDDTLRALQRFLA